VLSLYSLLLHAARPLARRVPRPPLAVTELEVPVPNLHPDLDGFCIAHVTDLHIGDGKWGPWHMEEVVSVIREARPDMVVNTGDFLEEEPDLDRITEVVPAFPELGPHLAVLGNHDYAAPADLVEGLKARLRGQGVEVMVNVGLCVPRGHAGVSVFGLTLEESGFEEALGALQTSGRPRVVLLHEPDLAERLPPDSADLVLAGHTHGGQVNIPPFERSIIRVLSGSRYTEGMTQVHGNRMYINRGLGFGGLPLRVNSDPEVAVIRLVH
jgi:predicted MPP superfamily phosphohydrolase